MRVPLRAWYFHSTVDLKKVRERFPGRVLSPGDPIVLDAGDGSVALVTSFGGLVFWPYEEASARAVAQAIQETLVDTELSVGLEERLVVETSRGQDRALYNEVWLSGEPRVEQMKIIATVLAQSVALENLEGEADTALEQFQLHLHDLRDRRSIRLSSKQILQQVGVALGTRHDILLNLALFDKPAECWDNEGLNRLYGQMFELFEIPERVRAVERKVAFLAENTSLLFNFLSTRQSLRLEWVVVTLIALELIVLGFELFK